MRFRNPVLAALCAIALLAPAPALAAKWLRGDTRNFIIYSAGSRQQLTDFATKVEKFDAMLRLLFKVAPDPHPDRLTIFVLGSSDNVADLYGDKTGFIAGFYVPSKDGSFAVANREAAESELALSGDTVLLHEYAHHFMFRNFAYAYPAWYVEGFAEYVATAEFKKDGTWSLGRVPFFRAYGLLESKQLPMDALLFGDTRKRSPEERNTFYGQSWLLVHMMSRDPARAGQLDAYLRAVAAGTPEREAAVKVFGDLNQLATDMNRYKLKPIHYSVLKNPLPYDPAITVAELDPVAGRLVELDMRIRAGKSLAASRDALVALTAQTPDRADAWYELALAERRIGHDAADEAARAAADKAALVAVDHALAIDPRHGKANSLKAELTIDRLAAADHSTPAQWSQVRTYIGRANATDTEDATPLYLYYQSFARQGATIPELARNGLAKAFALRPEAFELRANYAFDLAAHGKYDEALKIVEFVARDPHDPAAGEALLQQLRNRRDGTGSNRPGGAKQAKTGG